MPKSLGEKLQDERERKKLSLQEVADQIGSTKSYVWELENKPTIRPSAEKISKLAKLYEVTVDYLLDETGHVERDAEEQLEKAFFSKIRKLSPEHKVYIRRFIDSLDKDD